MKSDSLPPVSSLPFMNGVVVDGEARSLALPFRVFAERLPHFVWETDGWLTVVHELRMEVPLSPLPA